MRVSDLLRRGLRQLHQTYNDLLKDLTVEHLHWRANDRGVTIAFVAWHYVRTEDNIIQYVLQRKPTVWLEEGWDQKLGLDRVQQGTGWTLEQAQALRLPSSQAFYQYMQSVWRASEAFLETIDDDYLQGMTTIKPLGELPILDAIGSVCLTHGHTHAGEIQHLRGLQGLRGALV